MIRSLKPWTQLTRFGVPEFQVCRRPLTVQEVELVVGAKVPADLFPTALRMRQLYEQRLIEPVVAPANTVQEAVAASASASALEPASVREAAQSARKPTSNTLPFTPPDITVSEVDDAPSPNYNYRSSNRSKPNPRKEH